jgi:uncharacterized protein YqkB
MVTYFNSIEQNRIKRLVRNYNKQDHTHIHTHACACMCAVHTHKLVHMYTNTHTHNDIMTANMRLVPYTYHFHSLSCSSYEEFSSGLLT